MTQSGHWQCSGLLPNRDPAHDYLRSERHAGAGRAL